MKRAFAGVVVAACGASSSPSPSPSPSPPPQPAVASGVSAGVAGSRAQLVSLANGDTLAILDGTLVRFDRAMHRQATLAHATAIAAGAGGELFVGLDAGVAGGSQRGSIARLDPVTLVPHTFATVWDPPMWLAARPDELIVAFRGASDDHAIGRVRLADGDYTAFTLSKTGRPSSPSVLLLDHDTLWYGSDAGEWGGGVGRLDLATGRSTFVGLNEGVYGLARVYDKVFAFGGTVHLGLHDGFVAELDSTGDKLAEPVTRWKTVAGSPGPSRPIIELEPHGDGYLVLAWNELYDVDATFQTWKETARLVAHDAQGRPDAVGNYPAETSMLDGPNGLLFATRTDGLFVRRPDGEIHPVPTTAAP